MKVGKDTIKLPKVGNPKIGTSIEMLTSFLSEVTRDEQEPALEKKEREKVVTVAGKCRY